MALRVRRNQADLSGEERSRFAAAVKQMKATGAYNRFITIHQASMATPDGQPMNMWAHQRPGFPPWHRQLLLDFEEALRAADASLHAGAASDMTLPYWDWINYRTRKKFLFWGKIWGDNFLGPDGDASKQNAVTSGPFRAPPPVGDGDFTMFYTPNQAGPPATVMPDNNGPAFLQRQLGRNTVDIPSGSLPTQAEWEAAKAITVYDSFPWTNEVGVALNTTHFQGVPSFRNVLEGFVPYDPARREAELHNKVHIWVGGTMAPITSPNDPIFFLHHCNVDRLWAEWQLANPRVPYLPDGSTPALTGPEGHNLNDPFHPWDGISRDYVTAAGNVNITLPVVRIRDVLNHASLGYRYDTDPPSLAVGP